MDHLPNEILIEIFQHLSIVDLVNLSKVDVRYKEIINSTEKLKYFNLKFQKKGKTECVRNKRYGQLTVSHFNSRTHQNILNICGSTIANITFNTSELNFPKIALVLRLCPNVKQVKFENVSVWPEVIRNLPELKNVYVELNESSSCILDLFIKSTVSALIILTSTEEYGTGIRGFLRTQPNLKSIYCKGQKVLDLFYSLGNHFDENVELLKYRLKILVLREIAWRPHYIDLIGQSAYTLKFIELVDIHPVTCHELLEQFIDKCTRLEELSLQNIYFRNLRASSTITKVQLRHFVGPAEWLGDFTNLRKLKVSFQQAALEAYDTVCDFRKCEKLEEVEVTHCTIRNYFQIPSVRKMTLRHIRDVKGGGFVSDQNSIEEVTIEGCDARTDVILQEVSRKMLKVRTVNVTGGVVSSETIASVRRNCPKLVNFVIRNVRCEENAS